METGSPPVFDEVISSPIPLPAPRARSLAGLIFSPLPGEDDGRPVILGTCGAGPLRVSIRGLRRAVLRLHRRFTDLGLAAGDTACLMRLPRTSEALLAVVYAALAASRIRVFLPMYLDRASVKRWLFATGAKAVLWAEEEVLRSGLEADRELFGALSDEVRQAGIPAYCIARDLRCAESVADAGTLPESGRDRDEAAALAGQDDADVQSLIVSTSGTSGRARLVVYTERSLLNTCASWEAAGFFAPAALGGRCLCPLFAHTMGLRAFWNAVWTRQAICLVPPEWFGEHPERVRDLLVDMRPEHLTGGPAAFHTLIEFTRVFPEIKDTCFRHLRCLVSSGAPFDPALARRLHVALGLAPQNAFGMTETMQVISTIAPGPLAAGPASLGNPLPGVSIGLERAGDGRRDDVFRLWVRSPFACAGTLDDEAIETRGVAGAPLVPQGDWFFTGDLVARSDAEGLRHAGRESVDFFKDGFGVKVQRLLLAERYADLGEAILHVEFFPLREEPGLAALIFVDGGALGMRQAPAEDGWITEHGVLRRVLGLIVARHDQWQSALDDFELRHLTVDRFMCIAQPPPRTSKGNVSRHDIERRYAPLLPLLTGRFTRRDGLVQVPRERLTQSATTRMTSPRRGEMLRLGRLDKAFEWASGDRMSYRERGEWHEVVDFVGGFGANLLGHRHPDLIAAVESFVKGERPWISDQGSARPHEGRLAQKLSLRVGRDTGQAYVVRFGSTGAEAVEMALAHAWFERQEQFRKWKRKQRRLFGARAPEQLRAVLDAAQARMQATPPKVLVLEGSFHGLSLGARSLLSSTRRGPLYAPMSRLEKVTLPWADDADVDEIVAREAILLPALAEEDGRVVQGEARFSAIIAAIAEPVRGEGGISAAPIGLLRRLERREFPLILDEVQCGLGRTGTFLASQGVRGDYYCFGKALGGGLAKISALLVEQTRYVQRFDDDYLTTFAGDAFSCHVAETVLDLIERDRIPERAAERGLVLRGRLEALRAAHPGIIKSVEGRGVMQGVVLDPTGVRDVVTLRMAERHELLGMVAATYLLHRHGVRVLPSLSAPNCLRLEPSAFVSDREIDLLVTGLDELCKAIERRDSAAILGCLVEGDAPPAAGDHPETGLPTLDSKIEEARPDAERVAFFGHFILPEQDLAAADPGLRVLPPAARRALEHKLMALTEMKPTTVFARNLFDGRVWFDFIFFAVDAPTIEELLRSGRSAVLVERIQEGVDMAAAAGCKIAALGAYTSVVTNDGQALLPPAGMQLTTGNTMTVAVGLRRVRDACERHGIDPADDASEVAVVGATGNIGSAIAALLAAGAIPFRRLTLVARRPEKLQRLAERLAGAPGKGDKVPVLRTATEMDAIRSARVIVVATSTGEPLIYPHHLSAGGPVVIADVSAPAAVSPEVLHIPTVKTIPLAGTVTVPGCPDFVMASHIEPGSAFCCAAEAMLIGLMPADERARLRLIGPIDPATVRLFDRLAEEHGFYQRIGEGGFRPQR